jgi:hypothetical protein
MRSSAVLSVMENETDPTKTVLGQIALESPAIAELLEDLGYGPWKAASAKHLAKSETPIS